MTYARIYSPSWLTETCSVHRCSDGRRVSAWTPSGGRTWWTWAPSTSVWVGTKPCRRPPLLPSYGRWDAWVTETTSTHRTQKSGRATSTEDGLFCWTEDAQGNLVRALSVDQRSHPREVNTNAVDGHVTRHRITTKLLHSISAKTLVQVSRLFPIDERRISPVDNHT